MKRLRVVASFTVLLLGCGEDNLGSSVGEEGEGAAPWEHEHSSGAENEAALWEKAYEARATGKADTLGCSGVAVPDRPGFGKKVALTFDDGPSLSTTPQLLDFLHQEGIQATFFVNGVRVRGAAEHALLQRIVDEGHILANHTQHHPNMTFLSAQKRAQEIDQVTRIIKSYAKPLYFRFPFGAATCEAAQQVRDKGYAVTGWHVDSADWCYATSARGGEGNCVGFSGVWQGFEADMVGNVLAQTRASDGGVLLFHDIHAFTLKNIPTIIKSLEAEGFSFTNIDDITAFPLLNEDIRPELPFIGDECVASSACGFTEWGRQGTCLARNAFSSSDAGLCSWQCDGYCPPREGETFPFCTRVAQQDGGYCLSLCTSNTDCPQGALCQAVSRYIGNSEAPPEDNKVCMFPEWIPSPSSL